MGKGARKKTVWRTFSFENDYTNGTHAGDTNGLTAIHYSQEDGLDNNHDEVSNWNVISNGKYVTSWRAEQRRYNNEQAIDKNDLSNTKFQHLNGTQNGCMENGHRSEFYKQTIMGDKYHLRSNGLKKVDTYFQENGDENKIDFHDIHENQTMKPSQFRSNRSIKVPFSRHKKWDNRSNYNSNGILNNFSRGNIRKTFHSNQEATNEKNHTDEHFNENGLVKNVRNADDRDKCQDKASACNSTQQQRSVQHYNRQLHKFNEDEYTRISTPRSEVLFKKGYLMRDKKYASQMNATATSSNDSGSVSVLSNDETASYYSSQSMSPDNSTYNNGNNSSDSNSTTYPNDGFEHDLSLMYSSGFYDNNGYFYPYIPNNFDQFIGQTILMPYGSASTTDDLEAYDADSIPVEPMSPTDTKSIDEEDVKKCNSLNSEDISNSSMSENVSINNDSDASQNPITPPSSPLSPNEDVISCSGATKNEVTQKNDMEKSRTEDNIIENGSEQQTDTQFELQDDEKITKIASNEKDGEGEKNGELTEKDGDAVIPDNYSIPYFSPFIYVPPMPFVPEVRMPGTRYEKYRNYFGRPKRHNRFSRFHNNKVFIPTNWSEAPDEMAQINVTEGDVVEPKLGDENAVETIAPTSTIEQCDKILQNSKLNLNVSEFIPQNKRIIFVPLPFTPSPPPAPVYFLPIPSTESTLNVNVPEFLPKNYKPFNAQIDATEENDKKNPTSMENSATEMTTMKTNESNENQNDTTNHNSNNKNHTKGLTNNKKCKQKIDSNNQQHKQNDSDENAKNESKQNTDAPIQQNEAILTMSDLLKNNISDNLNITACSFNNENSHTNLKADLGNKNVTNNNIKKEIHKNDNHCNDSGSSKWSKLNNSSRNANTKNAYPNTKKTTTRHTKPFGQSLNMDKSMNVTEKHGKIDKKIANERPSIGLTYAQMMVPMKSTEPMVVKNTADQSKNKVTQENSKSEKSLINEKSSQNSLNSYGHRNNAIKKKVKKSIQIERIEKPVESIEWFTIDSKGKKHAALNDSQIVEIAFENETKEEKATKIAEELQLDIKNDSDLALDIMDSLTISKDESQGVIEKIPKKKRTTSNSNKTKKKFIKEKLKKEQKRNRCDTFDIIEPNFAILNIEQKSSQDEECAKNNETVELETNESIMNENEQPPVFDPNLFSIPCLQADNMLRTSAGQSNNALRLSTGKSPRNLINQFDIYQSNHESIENQQLKEEEEMVIKILQQLNKSFDVTLQKDETTVMDIIEEIAHTETHFHLANDHENNDRENSVERFAINAKPQQNVYASNHFLEHSFGDRNDSSDRVVISTDLSSSDQSHVEDDETVCDKQTDNYHVIATYNVEYETQLEMDLKANGYNRNLEFEDNLAANVNIENDETFVDEEKSAIIQSSENELETNKIKQLHNLNKMEILFDDKRNLAIESNLNEQKQIIDVETEAENKQEPEIEETQIEKLNKSNSSPCEVDESCNEVNHMSTCKKLKHASYNENINEMKSQVDEESVHEFQKEREEQAFGKTEVHEHSASEYSENSIKSIAEEPNNESITSDKTETIEMVDPEQSTVIFVEFNDENQSNYETITKPMSDDLPISDDELSKQNVIGLPDEPISHETEINRIEIDTASIVSCNQSVISNANSNNRPWLRIVDTQLLQQQKKLQKTFPITTAVSMWLNQAQKEKTPEPIFRVPDYRFFSATAKYKKQDSQTSHSNSSIDLTEDNASITSDKFHINDDDEDEIMNFWEPPTLQTSQSPTPPPLAYNSVYGSSINYTNLLSNKNELLCNNIIDFDASHGKDNKIDGFNENMPDSEDKSSAGIDEKCYRPPEVCCTIM